MLGEILQMFVNTLIVADKYRVQDCENLPLPIEIQFSEQQNTFSQFFVPFLECTSTFKHFETKDDRQS